MRDRPLVSVVLPTKNRAKLLRRAVHSVLAQTYDSLELLVVNDGSTDGTREFLGAVGDPRLRVFNLERSGGAAAARNRGVREARGSLLAFQDDDDIWLVDKLRKQVAFLAKHPDSSWCIGGYIRIAPNRVRYIGGAHYFKELDFDRGNGLGGPDYSLIATPGWLITRTMFDQAGGFDERIRSWDDWELGLRLFDICKPLHLNEPLFIQDHILGVGLMRAEHVRAADMRIILAKHGDRWARNREVSARHLYIIGRAESMYERPPAGRTMLWESLRLRPLGLRTWAALFFATAAGRWLGSIVTERVRARRDWT